MGPDDPDMRPITDAAQRERLQQLVSEYFRLEDESGALDPADADGRRRLDQRQDQLVAEMKAIRDPEGELDGALTLVETGIEDGALRAGVERLTERWWASVRTRFEARG